MKSSAVIGFRNHALKIINIIKSKTHLKYIYHPYKKINSKFTNNLRDILKVDSVFIASPTQTHFFYLNYLFKNNYKGYIFCEKLPVQKLDHIKKIKKLINNRLYFNFNLQHSHLLKILKRKNLGKLKVLTITDNKPYFLKKNKKKLDWRLKDKKILITNILPHYIHLIRKNFSKLEKNIKINYLKVNKKISYICVTLKSKSTLFNINLSYMQGLEKNYIFYFDKAKIEIKSDKLISYNHINKNNQKGFKNIGIVKQVKLKDLYKDSNYNSINYFIKKLNKNSRFSKKNILFDLKINEELLKLS